MSLSIKNKILLVLSALPIVSIGLVVFMALNLFKDDKITYVFNSVLSGAQAKSSSSSSQIQSFLQSLKALTVNYDPIKTKLTDNGETFLRSEKPIVAFFDHQWDGKNFQEKYKNTKDQGEGDLLEKGDALTHHLSEAWRNSIAIKPLSARPLHLLISARAGTSSNINTIVVEAHDFFSLFSATAQGESFLYHDRRGFLAGENEREELSAYLAQEVFSKKIDETAVETLIGERPFLVSVSKVSLAGIYVVSIVDKESALVAMEKLLYRSLFFTLALLSLLIFIGVFASNSLVAPLRNLSDATSKVMEGDFSVKVRSRGADEIGLLARNFNRMTEEVSRLLDKTAENARMESELKTAQTVQEVLFPQSQAHIGDLSLYGLSEPATECGGDWWYYSRAGNKTYIWIGDATGHGVPAALLTSAVRAVASVIEEKENILPSEAMAMLNNAIYATSKGKMMMTFFIACFDFDEKTLTYSNASHDPPFYLENGSGENPGRKDYDPMMEVNSPRLGEKKSSEFKDHTMKVSEGDKFVFYTDGILDVKNSEGKLWGERRFLKSLASINSIDKKETVDSVFQQISDFRKDTPLDDDVTLVLVELEKTAVAS